MWRRVGREDLSEAADRSLAECGGGDVLWVCEEYVIEGNEIVSKHTPPPWADDAGDSDTYSDSRWRFYMPLEETPGLFLELAALCEEEDFGEAALAFVHRYGVPGEVTKLAWFEGAYPETQSVSRVSLDEFRKESGRAWRALRMYEAVLNGDAACVRELFSQYSPWVGDEFKKMLEVKHRIFKRLKKHDAEEVGGDWMDLDEAMHTATLLVMAYVVAFCVPSIGGVGSTRWGEYPDPTRVTRAWEFKNLLGAAYLQMYWLMTSSGDLTRCGNCGRIVSRARPNPKGRKPRTDKRYCNSACKQAHHRSKKKT